ncbi:hypothetical protein Ahy_A09g045875 [Arachis hypogaea]|uniref:CCHC-type domain-containing protein n=1 Tax=Arachis hypogaea TaxID=3818 RepID=A0A445BNC5_ARAHY|nr:hypothetical protein Ahy_A09g045875 [Arachis hypogaea]
MKYLRYARCQVGLSMQLTYATVVATVVNSRLTEFRVDMCLLVLDWQVYVHDVYKMDQVRRVYMAMFRPLGNPATWPAYHGLQFVGNPFLRRVAKGCPKMTRFLNEMDTRMLRRPRRCKQCGAEGHSRSRSRCRQSAGPSGGPVEE